jgi:hypothetical protein
MQLLSNTNNNNIPLNNISQNNSPLNILSLLTQQNMQNLPNLENLHNIQNVQSITPVNAVIAGSNTAPINTPVFKEKEKQPAKNLRANQNQNQKFDVSNILKDEINELKKLTKEANSLVKDETSENNIIVLKNNSNSTDINNGPIVIDSNKADNLDINFAETKEEKYLTKVDNNIKQNPVIEDDNKYEFEDKLNYLLNKLDVIYDVIKIK